MVMRTRTLGSTTKIDSATPDLTPDLSPVPRERLDMRNQRVTDERVPIWKRRQQGQVLPLHLTVCAARVDLGRALATLRRGFRAGRRLLLCSGAACIGVGGGLAHAFEARPQRRGDVHHVA